ncbi:hypothetical protein MRB53_013494 [Persea americana]|uniref:Uncharacterized protein n=1 Tax=Persea americana TaxID=3435 RepID=A0ACC2K8S0_PERAE|nr:hypothetical protein MRB53_013494 [Persea americana]
MAQRRNSGDGDRARMDGGWWTVMDRPDSLLFLATTAAVASLFSDDAGRTATEDGSVRRWLRRQCGQRQNPSASCLLQLLRGQIKNGSTGQDLSFNPS